MLVNISTALMGQNIGNCLQPSRTTKPSHSVLSTLALPLQACRVWEISSQTQLKTLLNPSALMAVTTSCSRTTVKQSLQPLVLHSDASTSRCHSDGIKNWHKVAFPPISLPSFFINYNNQGKVSKSRLKWIQISARGPDRTVSRT